MGRNHLTTRECADLLNRALDMDGTVTAEWIRAEIAEGRLHARIYHKNGRRRAFIRVHRDDFREYCARVHPAAVPYLWEHSQS